MSMSSNRKNRLLAILLTAALLSVLCLPVLGADTVKTGSLTVELKTSGTDGTPLAGGEFKLYQVAAIDETAAPQMSYKLIGTFAVGDGLDINKVKTSDDVQKAAAALAGRIGSTQPNATVTTGADGKVVTTGLPLGIYLVVNSASPSGYYTTSAFLVYLPEMKDGQWSYDVTATPKVDHRHNPGSTTTSVSVTKVWNDAGSEDKRPASVTVGLYAGTSTTPAKTAELSSANSWKYTWTGLDTGTNWTVDEVSVPDGYESFVDGSNGSFTITNTRSATPLSGTVTASKVWSDKNDAAGKRPDSVSITLSHDGKAYETVELNAGNDWTKIWIGLPETGTWTVAENNVPAGYTAKVTVSGSVFTVTNTYTTDKTPGSGGGGGGNTTDIPDDNVPKGDTPYTGMLQWPIPVLLSVGTLMVLAGAFGGRKKKYAEA